jgi:hypothetical protein
VRAPGRSSLASGPSGAQLEGMANPNDKNRNEQRGGQNEGEGNKTADKQYREGATNFAHRTDTLQQGLEADREVQLNRPDFEQAEREGRSHSAGDLNKDLGSNTNSKQ